MDEILIIRPGALGDTLMLVPALVELQKGTRVTATARSPGLEALRHRGFRCVDFERAPWHLLFHEGPGKFPSSEIQPARVVAFMNDPEGLVRRNLTRFFPGAEVHVFPGYPEKSEKVHVALYLARMLLEAGIPLDPEGCLDKALRKPLMRPPGEGIPKSREGIVLHPGSGGREKNLGTDFWLETARGLIKKKLFGSEITVLLGPAEEALLGTFERTAAEGAGRLIFCPDMPELCRLLGSAALYLGHDSGVTHLSAMLGTPTAAVFKTSDPRAWSPLGPWVRVLAAGGESETREALDRAVEDLKKCCSTPLAPGL